MSLVLFSQSDEKPGKRRDLLKIEVTKIMRRAEEVKQYLEVSPVIVTIHVIALRRMITALPL